MFCRKIGTIESVLQELYHFVILDARCLYHSTDSAYFVKSTPLELSVYPFNTLQICYRHIVDVHEEIICKKKIFLTNLQHF